MWLCQTKLHINYFKEKNPEILKMFLGKIKDTLEYPKEIGSEICESCIEYEKKNSLNSSVLSSVIEEKLPQIILNISKEKILKTSELKENTDNLNSLDKTMGNVNNKKEETRGVVIVKNKNYYENDNLIADENKHTGKMNYNNNFHSNKNHYYKRTNEFNGKNNNKMNTDNNDLKVNSSKKKYGNYSMFKKDSENKSRPERSREYSQKRNK